MKNALVERNGTGLSLVEAKTLAGHEATIEKGLDTFYEVGAALCAIRDGRLYRQTHDTFEDYCRDRWNISRVHAHRLISANEVREELLPIGNILPTNESQARALASVPKKDRQAVWKKVIDKAPVNSAGQPAITAKMVEETKNELGKDDGPCASLVAEQKRPQALLRHIENKLKQFSDGERSRFAMYLKSTMDALAEEFDVKTVSLFQTKLTPIEILASKVGDASECAKTLATCLQELKDIRKGIQLEGNLSMEITEFLSLGPNCNLGGIVRELAHLEETLAEEAKNQTKKKRRQRKTKAATQEA